MKTINISELNISSEFVFGDVQCKLRANNIVQGTSGSLVAKGMDVFQFRTFKGAPYIDFLNNDLVPEYHELEIVDQETKNTVKDLFRRGYKCLAYVLMKPNNISNSPMSGIMALHLAFLLPGKSMGDLPIMISDKVKKTLISKRYFKEKDDINSLLNENFCMIDGMYKRSCFCYFQTFSKESFIEDSNTVDNSEANDSSNDSSEADGYNDNVNVSDKDIESAEDSTGSIQNESGEDIQNDEYKGFILYGKNFNLVVGLCGTDTERSLIAKRILPANRKAIKMMLGNGNLQFTDTAEAIGKQIGEIFNPSGEYVRTWEAYSNMEGEFMLQRARQIGVLKFDVDQKASYDEQGNIQIALEYSAKKALTLLNTNDNLDCVEEVPLYLSDYSVTWEQYKTGRKKAKDSDAVIFENAKSTALNKTPINIIRLEPGTCSIVLEGADIPKGKLILSLRGYETQIIRRETARKNIMEGTVPNPRIAEIIANNIDENATMRDFVNPDIVSKIPAMSSFVKKKIFPNPKQPPTPTQEEAIEIALNTPDIAIIQGPPGTGKTTVITAVLERLNELSDKNNMASGRVLITSLQHDAVNNVIERIKINSLPTIKFGRKLNQEDTVEGSVDLWCDQLAARLIEKNPVLKNNTALDNLTERMHIYLADPTEGEAYTFLTYMSGVTTNSELKAQISIIKDNLSVDNNYKFEQLLPKIRRIRDTGKAFMDDGAQVAGDLLFAIDEYLTENTDSNNYILSTLRKAYSLNGEPNDEVRARLKENDLELLKDLKQVKNLMLEKCIPRVTFKKPEPLEDVMNIYYKIHDEISRSKSSVDSILFDLLNELENNQVSVRNAVAQYSYAYAATAQQSQGKDIIRAKRNNPEYDTIIVDEAARVNPGDLMVPLAQAKKRIILVGDHRQLPHMYDQEIFDALQEQNIKVNEEDVRVSMFQQLLQKAKILEKIDGRKRFITLDKQYRTHPLLGKFVSDEYYKPYGESYDSPLGEEFFEQSYFKKPLVWLDVPYEAGNEQRNGTSRLRNCESKIIAARIAACVEKDEQEKTAKLEKERKDLEKQGLSAEQLRSAIERAERDLNRKQMSYGVISFYSSQVADIKRELRVKLKGKVEELFKRQKLRVGSVDAFQGMEFDVIFLSVVRTGKSPLEFDISKDEHLLAETEDISVKQMQERIASKNYGFLTSPNRMCVAMSRQKKVLIVVGDSNIFVGEKYRELAEKFVPGMKHLYELAKEKGVIEHVR